MARAIGPLTKYPARFSVLSYAIVIALGGTLLTTSAAVVPGQARLTAVDAVFTATSAACVTGLTVRSTAHDLSFLGQTVVLLLMQIGGIGIVTITTFITFHLRGGGMRDRALASAAIGVQRPTDLRSTLSSVVVFTLLIEAIATLILTLRGLLDYGFGQSLWHAMFHSISAYCNAGFALHDDSLTRYQGDAIVNAVIMGLIVVGGIGFPVIVDVYRTFGTDFDRGRHITASAPWPDRVPGNGATDRMTQTARPAGGQTHRTGASWRGIARRATASITGWNQ